MKREFIYGLNAVVEALGSGAALEEIHLASGLRVAARRDLERLAAAAGVPVRKSTRRELDRLARGGVHQGVVAAWGMPAPVALEELAAGAPGPSGRVILVCLDQVQDPRNVGAVARSALAFGAAGLVLPSRRAAGPGGGALKASAGALARLPVAQVGNLGQALERLKSLGFWTSGAVLEGGQAPWEFDPGDKVALVLGSEGGGLRRGVAGKLDFAVRIPMGAASESLNVSVAGALLLYEWLARPPAG